MGMAVGEFWEQMILKQEIHYHPIELQQHQTTAKKKPPLHDDCLFLPQKSSISGYLYDHSENKTQTGACSSHFRDLNSVMFLKWKKKR
jgi:hypothetical protein